MYILLFNRWRSVCILNRICYSARNNINIFICVVPIASNTQTHQHTHTDIIHLKMFRTINKVQMYGLIEVLMVLSIQYTYLITPIHSAHVSFSKMQMAPVVIVHTQWNKLVPQKNHFLCFFVYYQRIWSLWMK